QYRNENHREIRSFLKENSFGILVNQRDGKLLATHIPIELDDEKEGITELTGHLSKENPQWKNFIENGEVLAIFPGPHSYVSSSWYQHEEVPTWNYIAVHVYGSIQIMEKDALLDSLRKMVDKYEQNSENPVAVDRMSEKTMRQINGIIGFKITVREIQAVSKLSQNRNNQDYQNIVHQLAKSGDAQASAIAEAMKKKRN
ncbi:MAG: FMN-binding negative transcriptional regulator, partial [Flavobacteriaceae bacterium]|nr:FMN-binding negative transcriptional regulator [Flavobacteriaceae bacterium]